MATTGEETVRQRRLRLRKERAARTAETATNIVQLMPADRQKAPRAPRRVPSVRAGQVAHDGRGNFTMSDRWATIFNNVKRGEYTWEEFCDGLDPEELARGQLKNVDGTFGGRPPKVIPREFFLACQRELHRRFNELMQEALLEATQMYIKLAKDVADPVVQERMLRYIMERVVGPVPKEVKVSASQSFEGFLGGVVRKSGTVSRKARYAKRTDPIDEFEEEFEDQE